MKIGIIGIRGIPVTYSAFETAAEVVSKELVKKKHHVSVYGRIGLVPKTVTIYKGVEIIPLPHIPAKNWSTISHSFLSTIHACFTQKFDVILYFGVGSTIFSILPRFFGINTVVHIDGMDWKREKWGWVGKSYLKFSESLTRYFPNAVITDSQYMVSYYKKKYHKNIYNIPNGYFENSHSIIRSKVLKKYHVKKRKYFIWVGRLVPDNHIEEFIQAFSKLQDPTIKCVILGDDLFQTDYKKSIYELIQKDTRIIHKGFVSHEDVLALEEESLAYIETKRSGGTHMSLVEAMGNGCLIVSHINPGSREVLQDTALYYNNTSSKTSLETILKTISKDTQKFASKRAKVKKHAQTYYRWDVIVEQFEGIFTDLLNLGYRKSTKRHRR